MQHETDYQVARPTVFEMHRTTGMRLFFADSSLFQSELLTDWKLTTMIRLHNYNHFIQWHIMDGNISNVSQI